MSKWNAYWFMLKRKQSSKNKNLLLCETGSNIDLKKEAVLLTRLIHYGWYAISNFQVSASTNRMELKFSPLVYLDKRLKFRKISRWPPVWFEFYTPVSKLPCKSQQLGIYKQYCFQVYTNGTHYTDWNRCILQTSL